MISLNGFSHRRLWTLLAVLTMLLVLIGASKIISFKQLDHNSKIADQISAGRTGSESNSFKVSWRKERVLQSMERVSNRELEDQVRSSGSWRNLVSMMEKYPSRVSDENISYLLCYVWDLDSLVEEMKIKSKLLGGLSDSWKSKTESVMLEECGERIKNSSDLDDVLKLSWVDPKPLFWGLAKQNPNRALSMVEDIAMSETYLKVASQQIVKSWVSLDALNASEGILEMSDGRLRDLCLEELVIWMARDANSEPKIVDLYIEQITSADSKARINSILDEMRAHE